MPSPTDGSLCGNCQGALVNHYFQANGTPICQNCIGAIQQLISGSGSSTGRFFKAALYGLGAAALGAIGYGLWMGMTNSEFALVTIAMGWLIGKCVRLGSGNRGGWRYGLLAVVLTYFAISFSFLGVGVTQLRNGGAAAIVDASSGISKSSPEPQTVPASASASAEEAPSPGTAPIPAPVGFIAGVVMLAVFAISMPVISASESILSLVITGFGLWQAWSMNRSVKVEITGPHPVANPSVA